jgi:formate dehydrogenase (NADP+) beta subunit
VCPVSCLTIAPDGTLDELKTRLSAPAQNPSQPIYVSDALPQTRRVMVKDEDICLHCGLCAERCPTAALAAGRPAYGISSSNCRMSHAAVLPTARALEPA